MTFGTFYISTCYLEMYVQKFFMGICHVSEEIINIRGSYHRICFSFLCDQYFHIGKVFVSLQCGNEEAGGFHSLLSFRHIAISSRAVSLI